MVAYLIMWPTNTTTTRIPSQFSATSTVSPSAEGAPRSISLRLRSAVLSRSLTAEVAEAPEHRAERSSFGSPRTTLLRRCGAQPGGGGAQPGGGGAAVCVVASLAPAPCSEFSVSPRAAPHALPLQRQAATLARGRPALDDNAAQDQQMTSRRMRGRAALLLAGVASAAVETRALPQLAMVNATAAAQRPEGAPAALVGRALAEAAGSCDLAHIQAACANPGDLLSGDVCSSACVRAFVQSYTPCTQDVAAYVLLQTFSSIVQGCDPCVSNPCSKGSCVEHPDGQTATYSCSCAAGFSGALCDHVSDVCESRPCHNSGNCIALPTAGAARYQCACIAGYAGVDCEASICASRPCANGGLCSSKRDGYTCSCASGWTGANCMSASDPCASQLCNHGRCIGDTSGATPTFTCLCQNGYQGTLCADPICVANYCKNGGTCAPAKHGPACSCRVGFAGPTCAEQVCAGDADPCGEHGECHVAVNAQLQSVPSCTCSAGFMGDDCSASVCESAPCMNGGECSSPSLPDSAATYSCACVAGFGGTNCDTEQHACDSAPCLGRLRLCIAGG
jgi:hypothetical protein